MKKITKKIFFAFLCLITLNIANIVKADDISIDDIITYMTNNNLLETEEYFYMFGAMLNGNNEYDITRYTYTIDKTSTEINITSTLTDRNSPTPITIDTKLTYTGNVINYTNPNEIDSLESRVASVVLSELIYSLGGARGYSQSVLVDWMNQIDVNSATLDDDGFEGTFETRTYNITRSGTNYRYIVNIPTRYTINTEDITATVPRDNTVVIQNIQPSVTSIEMTVFSANNSSSNCNVYRKNNETNTYQLIATVSCQNGAVVDNNLEPNTTYTYQATVANKIMCATDIQITTENAPDTGYFIGISIAILISAGSIAYITYKKNNRFKKI